jgi:hypothetical protein
LPHTQSETLKLPDIDVKVFGQVVHALAPVWFEYVPAGHETHTAEEFAPATIEYVPAGHNEHDVAPNAAY